MNSDTLKLDRNLQKLSESSFLILVLNLQMRKQILLINQTRGNCFPANWWLPTWTEWNVLSSERQDPDEGWLGQLGFTCLCSKKPQGAQSRLAAWPAVFLGTPLSPIFPSCVSQDRILGPGFSPALGGREKGQREGLVPFSLWHNCPRLPSCKGTSVGSAWHCDLEQTQRSTRQEGEGGVARGDWRLRAGVSPSSVL